MEDQPAFELIHDPCPFSEPEDEGRASDKTMGDLHGRTAHEITRMLTHGNVRTKLATLGHAIKFLKDNSITSDLKKNPRGKSLHDVLPTPQELERLMRLTPDQDR